MNIKLTKLLDAGRLFRVMRKSTSALCPNVKIVVRTDDGKILNTEWESGYDQWSIGQRVNLTTENGSGIMFFEDKRTQDAVFRL